MRAYVLSQRSDAELLRDLIALVARERATTARLLAHIAEVEQRRLYAPAGYESMHAYCVGELGFTESSAYKRLQAARMARAFPALFGAIAEGTLNLTGLLLVGPHLTAENTDELIAAVAHQSIAEIGRLLGARSPAAEAPPLFDPMSKSLDSNPTFCAPADPAGPTTETATCANRVPRGGDPALEPQRPYQLKVNLTEATRDKLLRARDLLSHAVPSGDLALVLDRALDALLPQLETRKLGSARPARRPQHRAPALGTRTVPAPVRRAVWERDGGRCTFASVTGRRCGARRRLEFDHVVPVARGGVATVDGIRLRCRTHNQYEAERLFGAAFMRHKRSRPERNSDTTATPPAALENVRDASLCNTP
jgi:5-methylcytosine-specific restriction endonuclease McrA